MHMRVCSNSEESDRTGSLTWVLAAAMLMVILLSVLAGMMMGINIFENLMVYALWAGTAAAMVSLALILNH